jgi:hypothetical protein
MILVIYGIAKYCSQLSQKNARVSEMNARGKMMQVITLVGDKNVFYETLNVSCSIWHCKNYSQNAWGKLHGAVTKLRFQRKY